MIRIGTAILALLLAIPSINLCANGAITDIKIDAQAIELTSKEIPALLLDSIQVSPYKMKIANMGHDTITVQLPKDAIHAQILYSLMRKGGFYYGAKFLSYLKILLLSEIAGFVLIGLGARYSSWQLKAFGAGISLGAFFASWYAAIQKDRNKDRCFTSTLKLSPGQKIERFIAFPVSLNETEITIVRDYGLTEKISVKLEPWKLVKKKDQP